MNRRSSENITIVSAVEKSSLISVVIPSLGKINLFTTINILNSGTLVPDEILICVPVGTRLPFDIPSNSKVIYCIKRSQVAQRAEGFKIAKSEFVLQLDDDTHLAPTCLEQLRDVAMKCQNNCAIAPTILNIKTKESIYKNEQLVTTFNTIKYFVANGHKLYVPGTITKVGSCFGPIFAADRDSNLEVEWLAGCCILHRRSNLNCDDFYPFTGKAYCEDLIASYYYKLKSIVFYSCNKAFCFTVPGDPQDGSLLELMKELRARHYFVVLSGRPIMLFYAYAVFRCGFEVLINMPKKLIRRIRVGYA